MKHFIFLIVIALLFSLPVSAQKLREVSIAWEEGEKPPYLMLDDQNLPYGIAVEMLEEILKHNGITPIHRILPWKRCLIEIKEKEVDIVPNASFKKERTAYAYYSNPFYQTHLVLLYKINNFKEVPVVRTVEDLKPYKVGGVLGFNYIQYENKIQLDTGAKKREILIRKLRNDRVDFAVLQNEVILNLAKAGKVDLSGLDIIPDPVRPIKAYHLLTIKNARGEKIKNVIDGGLDWLEKSGTTDAILKKYLIGSQ
jgi:polar amino acid transport system substrate-binding protein